MFLISLQKSASLISTHNICFLLRNKKISCGYPLLSENMVPLVVYQTFGAHLHTETICKKKSRLKLSIQLFLLCSPDVVNIHCKALSNIKAKCIIHELMPYGVLRSKSEVSVRFRV